MPSATSTPDVGSGFSKGAIAGITVGAVALIALVLVALLLLRRRKRKQQSGEPESYAKSELPADSVYKQGNVIAEVQQMPATPQPSELPTEGDRRQIRDLR